MNLGQWLRHLFVFTLPIKKIIHYPFNVCNPPQISYSSSAEARIHKTMSNPLYMVTIPLDKTILLKIPGDTTSKQYSVRGTVWFTT